MAIQQDPPPDSDSSKKESSGARARQRWVGRGIGVRNLRTRETDELLRQLGHDPPHIALLKLGNDDKIDLQLRAQMLAWAAPFFGSKNAPAPALRFVLDQPSIGRLTDAASAAAFTSAVTEHVRAGKMDFAAGEFFLRAASLFASLCDKAALQTEVEKHRALEAAE
jgi:hypothetical protein